MDQADDQIRILLLQAVDGQLGAGIEVVKGCKGDLLDETGIDLGGGLRGFQAEEADLQGVRLGRSLFAFGRLLGFLRRGQLDFDDGGGGQDALTGLVEVDIGADGFKLRVLQVLHQLGIAEVKFVVAEGDDVVAGGIHHLDGAQAL